MMRNIFSILFTLSLAIDCFCVPIGEFFPFGMDAGDAKLPVNDDGSSPRVTISSLFPFFNKQHNSLFVNTNGAISFNRTLNTFTPWPFPLPDGRRIIAPFWADIDIRKGGNVYYRETTNRTILDRASNEVKKYFPSQMKFQATWVFIATWDNVTFYGADSIGKTKRNTFQAVLITNGRHSFTFMLFNRVQWTTGTLSGGNATTGLGGTPAQVGFNAGDGVNYFALNASRSPDIINVPTMSNVDKPGKFVFRIDAETIEKGGCNTGGTLTITPRHGTMLGGQKLAISGPCLTQTDNITATYGVVNKEYPCERRDEFSMTCITPVFYSTGDILIMLNVVHEDGSLSNYTGIYTILNIANTKPVLIRTNPQRWKFGQTVETTWKKEQLPFDDEFVKLDIFFVILKGLDFNLELLHGGPVSRNISVDQEKYSFLFRAQIYVALLRLSPADSTDVWHTEGAWSDVFPVVPLSNSISRTLCSVWYTDDKKLQSVTNAEVQPCPCTLQQALLDTGRFHRDPMCNSGGVSNTLNCINDGSTQHCIRLNVVGRRGLGRLCCYDTTGTPMDSRNLKGGGTVHRRHYFGSDGNIPFLSNFYFDLVPYLQCCLYAKENGGNNGGPNDVLSQAANSMTPNIVDDTCPKFFERRPASDCKGYVSPRPARASGDPHMKTIDGLAYTFNGVGEYVLLKDNKDTFIAQARMEQFINDNGLEKKASVFTSVVARTENVSDTIEVKLNSIRIADVLLNGELIDFTESSWLDFKGVSVLLLEDQEQRNGSKEILVMFKKPRISFQVTASKYLLNIITVVSDEKLKGKIEGLLGNYDDDSENDLRNDNGTIIPSNSSLQLIHVQFGESWRVKPEESLFTYPIGKTYADFANPAFEPNFIAPIISVNIDNNTAYRVCGSNIDCHFDLQTTGSEEIARSTKEITETFKDLEVAAEPVVSCGLPPGITNGQWNATGYIGGSTTFLICDDGYTPTVSGKIVCGSEGEWDTKNVRCVKNELSGTPAFNITYLLYIISVTILFMGLQVTDF